MTKEQQADPARISKAADPQRMEALVLATNSGEQFVDDTMTRAHAYFDFLKGGEGYGRVEVGGEDS